MTTAAYIRVSSRTQTHDMQRAAIERAAAARGEVIGEWYSETKSGGTMDRTVLKKVRDAARRGLVRRLYVYRIDRLTRTGIKDTFEIIDELRRHGCELVSISDGFSLDGPAAEIILAVMAWAAKMERLAINERIAAARDRVEAEGRKWGRPTVVDDALAQRIVTLRNDKLSLRAIATTVGLPLTTVARAIRRSSLAQLQQPL